MIISEGVLRALSTGERANLVIYGKDSKPIIMALLNNEIGRKIDCINDMVYVRLDIKELQTLAEVVPTDTTCVLEP